MEYCWTEREVSMGTAVTMVVGTVMLVGLFYVGLYALAQIIEKTGALLGCSAAAGVGPGTNPKRIRELGLALANAGVKPSSVAGYPGQKERAATKGVT
jgi:type IV secretory pathway TrbL component